VRFLFFFSFFFCLGALQPQPPLPTTTCLNCYNDDCLRPLHLIWIPQ
jgi:hypothetical protein